VIVITVRQAAERVGRDPETIRLSALPEEWKTEPYINVVRAIQLSRKGH